MEQNRREYNREKLEKLLADFPAAYHKYVCDEIDQAQILGLAQNVVFLLWPQTICVTRMKQKLSAARSAALE